ncbi:MAG: hypothetical protein J6032_01290 [Bacteroidales bacterium]|nr:hypothetical protein [Bacteroidales bacterium]
MSLLWPAMEEVLVEVCSQLLTAVLRRLWLWLLIGATCLLITSSSRLPDGAYANPYASVPEVHARDPAHRRTSLQAM